MASLNEAVGDGCFIDLKVKSLQEAFPQEELLSMNPEQTKQAEDMLCCQCAKQVAACYEGTCCMGATIHAHVPQQDSLYDSFYYDEEWMLKWHKAIPRQKPSCADLCKALIFPE